MYREERGLVKRYNKIIFICTNNTYLSPMAEAIYRARASEELPESISRGIVVLFSEPVSPKVNVVLSKYNMFISEHISTQFGEADLAQDTLYLTMTFSEKVKLLEEYSFETQQENVYTLGEFVGEDTDIMDPYGREEDEYEKCYEEISRRIDVVIGLLKQD